jgi:hypothetical protein
MMGTKERAFGPLLPVTGPVGPLLSPPGAHPGIIPVGIPPDSN